MISSAVASLIAALRPTRSFLKSEFSPQLSVDTADPDWAAQLRTVAHHFRQLALAHPNVVPLLVTRSLATPLFQRHRLAAAVLPVGSDDQRRLRVLDPGPQRRR